jgi:hypothetical protein
MDTDAGHHPCPHTLAQRKLRGRKNAGQDKHTRERFSAVWRRGCQLGSTHRDTQQAPQRCVRAPRARRPRERCLQRGRRVGVPARTPETPCQLPQQSCATAGAALRALMQCRHNIEVRSSPADAAAAAATSSRKIGGTGWLGHDHSGSDNVESVALWQATQRVEESSSGCMALGTAAGGACGG